MLAVEISVICFLRSREKHFLVEMVKTIFATFKDQKQDFKCDQHEFLDKVSEAFQINKEDIVIFAKHQSDRYKIQPHDLKNLMRVEIRNKKERDPRNLRQHFTVEMNAMESLEDRIETKLRNNTPLTGQERKSLIQWIHDKREWRNPKRKHNDVQSKISTANKRVQVDVKETKDSFAQADFEEFQLNHSSSEEEDVESIMQKMKMLAYNDCQDKEEIKKLMTKTFHHRRNFIMYKNPSVVVVRDEFPLLFSYEEIKNEMRRIFYPGICEQFISKMQNTAEVILSLLKGKQDEVYLRTIKSREKAQTDHSKMYATAVGSIFILAKHLQEDCCFIELKDNDFPSSLCAYPHISAPLSTMKDIFFDTTIFHIIVEEKKVCEAPDIPEAILCLMAVYFIFNIDYPKNCFRTFTVFEKLFLGANDTSEIDLDTAQTLKFLKMKTS